MVHRRRDPRPRQLPPQGVFYNRMSASSHTRGHRYAAELTGGVLAWLEAHGRRVINNGRALQLEISKMAQYAALSRYGIRVPHTVAAVGRDAIVEAARQDARPLHHQAQSGGQGTRRAAVRRRRRARPLCRRRRVRGFGRRSNADPAIHRGAGTVHHARRIHRRQAAVRGARRHVARVRAMPGRRLPGRRCVLPGRRTAPAPAAPRFRIIDGFSHPIVERYRRFLADNGIGIAGIEFITDRDGELYTYDVNTNTNYNSDAEREAGVFGMRAIAAYLGDELHALDRRPVRQRAAA